MSVEKFILKINFEGELKNILSEKISTAGYQINGAMSTKDVVGCYFNIFMREIFSRPRTVHISKELTANMPQNDLRIGFDRIIALASSGKYLNSHLSKNLVKANYKDVLLYDWLVHHLHLGHLPQIDDPRFICRTGPLLYVRVEKDDFYCIDILGHDLIEGFANQRLLEIVHNNWPHLLSSNKLNLDKGYSLTNQQIHQVRDIGATTCITVTDGTTYVAVGGGYACDRSRITANRQTEILMKRILWAESAIKNREDDVRLQIVKFSGRCPRTIKISLRSWDETGLFAHERKTNTELKFPWEPHEQ